MSKIRSFLSNMSFTQILVFGYTMVILVSAVLLMLPISSRERAFTALNDCIFTTTSALSGTGLTLFDTYTYWSLFGQIVILIVIQIGGIGFMSMAIFALSYTGRKIGLKQRFTMRESVAGISGGGVVKMTRFILKGTIYCETAGAIALSVFFIPKIGVGKGIYFAIFHSISAFCTAGIDIMGYFEPGSSIITAADSWLLNITLIILLTIGGIGYITWGDVVEHKWHFKKYRLQSKIVIMVTILFYILGIAEMILVEWNAPSLSSADGAGQKLLMSSMLVTSGRDAGFAPLNVALLKESTLLMIICFMFIGGAPGSTACGIKTTTFAVMVLTIASVFRRKKSVECFGRRFENTIIKDASCVTTLYLLVVIISSIVISAIENMNILPVMFEVVSAISSCGLSMGITTKLSDISCALITIIMFFGRIGGLSFIMSLSNNVKPSKVQLPEEKIIVG